MTSSSPETSTHTTGAHRASRRTPRWAAHHPPARHEPHLDGLFTYCLSVLCDHDAAIEVLGDVLALAERQHGRCPAGAEERKAWLYALARWACLRRLTEQRSRLHGTRAGRHAPGPVPESATDGTSESRHAEQHAERHAELALLAWPEAAGTTPEQREILELAVRHQLGPHEVAAILSMELLTARELLASAACEVERTRAALTVVETGDCPSVARLTGDHQVLLSAALRRELVRHVDDCPRCRRIAERAEAAGPWPGSPRAALPGGPGAAVEARPVEARPSSAPAGNGAPGARRTAAPLPLVEAPRDAAYSAMTRARRARGTAPRFGRNGFPMDPKDRAARRDRLRARAVTTTVVATVVAAPLFALWAAYRGAPETGEGSEGGSISATEEEGQPGLSGLPGRPYDHYENAGNAQNTPGPRFARGSRAPDVSVEVISDGTVPAVAPVAPGLPAPGRLGVVATTANGTTALTLTASGGAPVTWSAATDAFWLRLSRTSGTLAPGESVTIRVLVDHDLEPEGPWSAYIALRPSGSTVRIEGAGATPAPDVSAGPGHPGRAVHHRHHKKHRGHPGRHRPGRPARPHPTDPAPPAGPAVPDSPDPGTGQEPSDQLPGGPAEPTPGQDPSDPATGSPTPADPAPQPAPS